MSTIIKAVFDSTDFADNALAELRRSNINVQAYKSTPLERHNDETDASLVLPAMSNDSSASLGMMPSSGLSAGAVFAFGAPFMPVNIDSRIMADTVSDEVIVNLTVDDAQSDAVQAALVSMGGRQVGVL